MKNIIVLPILIPILTAIFMLLTPSHRLQRVASLFSAFLYTLVSALLFSILFKYGIISLPISGWEAPLGINLTLDLFSGTYLILSSIILCLITLHFEQRDDSANTKFSLPVFHLLFFFLTLTFLIGDLVSLFIALEGITVVRFISLMLQNKPQKSTLSHIIIQSIASLLLILSIGLAYRIFGTFNLADIAQSTLQYLDDTRLHIFSMTLLSALALKVGLFPPFQWTQEISEDEPRILSPFLSIIYACLGTYLLYRFCFTVLPITLPVTQLFLYGIATLSIIWGGLKAILKTERNTVINSLCIAHIGIIIFSLLFTGSTAIASSIYFTLSSILILSSLLIISTTITAINNQMKNWIKMIYIFQVISLFGFPFTSGSIAKYWILKTSLIQHPFTLTVMIAIISLVTVFSLLKLILKDKKSHSSTDTIPIGNWQRGAIFLSVGLPLLLMLGFNWIEPWIVKTSTELENPSHYVNSVLSDVSKPVKASQRALR